MPSLVRFVVAVSVLCGLVYGAMLALVTFVHPNPREFSVTVPPDRFVKEPR
jgi:hypothetical protein